jgi:hypothetical protein
MHWAEFEAVAPELAQLGRTIFERDEVALVGTIRRDGSPRISPTEPDIVNGRLFFGMIWQSYKALDLLRDPRCTVHGLVHDRFGKGGEFKLHGRAVEISATEERASYRQAIFKRIGWEPEEPNYHLFAIDIQSAGSFVYEEETRLVTVWRAGEQVEKYRQFADGRREVVNS